MEAKISARPFKGVERELFVRIQPYSGVVLPLHLHFGYISVTRNIDGVSSEENEFV